MRLPRGSFPAGITIFLIACLAVAALVRPVRGVEPRLFIFDNDFLGPGGSDIQSVMPLLAAPDVTLLGFTVVTGDGWLDEETAYLLRFLEVARANDIPVVPGALYPLVNTQARMAAWEQLYGKLPWKGAWDESMPGATLHPTEPHRIVPWADGMPKTKPAPEVAANFLIRQVRAHPHQVTIVAAGPLTNLALAIRLDPAFAELAKELVLQGANDAAMLDQVTGNANFAADFNIWFDPEAAHIVLTAPWPKITSIGSTVINDTPTNQALLDRIAQKKTATNEYLARYAVKDIPLWDETATAVAVDRSLILKSVDAYMDVDMDFGVDYGRVHAWPDALTPHQGVRKVTVVTRVDTKRVVDAYVKAAQFQRPSE
jgi:inosine-uridine nucleoside N-ribohydrolase